MYTCDAVTVKGLQRSHFSSSYHVPGYGEKILTDNFLHSQGIIAALCVTQFQGDYLVYCFEARKKWSNIVNFIPNLIKNTEFNYKFEVQKREILRRVNYYCPFLGKLRNFAHYPVRWLPEDTCYTYGENFVKLILAFTTNNEKL